MASSDHLSNIARSGFANALAAILHLVTGCNILVRVVVEWLADLNARGILDSGPLDAPMVVTLSAIKNSRGVHGDPAEDDLRSHLCELSASER